MPHPNGGQGSRKAMNNFFQEAHKFISDKEPFDILSTTVQKIKDRTGFIRDGVTPTNFFEGHRNVCPACGGYRLNCSGTRIGHCVEALDNVIK
jgi:hypothetical protein